MTGFFLPKMEFVTYQVQELYSKRLREGYKSDSMLLNTKIFCEYLKPFLLRSMLFFTEIQVEIRKLLALTQNLFF